MFGLSIPVFVVWLFNIVILSGILILVYYFVLRDARKRRFSRLRTVMWTIISIVLFPVGFLLYLLSGRKKQAAL